MSGPAHDPVLAGAAVAEGSAPVPLAAPGTGAAQHVPLRRAGLLAFRPVPGDGAPRWLVTFADLVALLVAFFVMMLSMSAFEPDSVARAPQPMAGASGAADTDAAVRAPVADTGAGARYLAQVLTTKLAALGSADAVTLVPAPGGSIVMLPRALVTDPAVAPDLRAVLARLADGAPGRVTLYLPAPDAVDAAWREALASAAAIRGERRAAEETARGIAPGIAGWLPAGQAAIAIRDREAVGRAGL